MISDGWAVPGDLDSGRWFGEQFHMIHDRLLPHGRAAEQTAAFLHGLTGRPDPVVTELGVGTGRIALPLARCGATVTGVDASPQMLDACRAWMGPVDVGVVLVEADIRDWRAPSRADLVFCVNGTLSLLLAEQDQRRAIDGIAAAVRPGGTVVIEDNNPAVVRLLHEHRRSVELVVPLDGAPDHAEVACLFDEDRGVWQLEYRWEATAGGAGVAIERMLLIGPDELVAMATDAGLSRRAIYADWAGTPFQSSSPSYVCVFSAPDRNV